MRRLVEHSEQITNVLAGGTSRSVCLRLSGGALVVGRIGEVRASSRGPFVVIKRRGKTDWPIWIVDVEAAEVLL